MPINILLVEDESIIAMAEKMQLEKNGYNVTIACNGESALQKCVDNTNLILMDIDLGPGMSGVEAASILLNKHNLPVVFLSSHTEPEVVETTEKITSYGYILKNSGITVLLASIKMALKLCEANKKLEEKEKSYREMFDANPHPMWVYDLETLKVLAVNNAAIAFYGYSREEFLKMKITDFRPIEDLNRLKENIEKVTEGIDIAGKWRHRLKNGRVITTSIISHTIDWFDRRAEVVLSLIEDKDMT